MFRWVVLDLVIEVTPGDGQRGFQLSQQEDAPGI